MLEIKTKPMRFTRKLRTLEWFENLRTFNVANKQADKVEKYNFSFNSC